MELNEEVVKKSLDWLYSLVGNSNDSDIAMFTYQLLGILYDTCEELTEKNERLKGRNEHLVERLDIEDKYMDRLRGILLQFTDTVHKWGNKNGYDTSEIALVPIIYEANTIKSQIEADTVRKMQERLKERKVCYSNITFKVVPIDEIDQIAKEMLEGKEICKNIHQKK